MKFSKLIEKLEQSENYKKFKEENKQVFFSAGFFILNFKDNLYEYNLDFRDEENLFGFKMVDDTFFFHKENILDNQQKLGRIDQKIKLKIDIEDLKEKVQEQLGRNNITNKLNEIIAVLQEKDKKTIWNMTCMLEGFVIISIQLDAISGDLIIFEKKSLFDFMKPGKK